MFEDISALYAAAAGEEDWDRALGQVRERTGAEALILQAGDLKTPEASEAWTSGKNAAYYRDVGYTDADTWNPAINPCIAPGLTMPLGISAEFGAVVPDDTVKRSEFLQSTLIPSGFKECRLYVPARSPDFLSGGLFAKGGNRAFDPDEISRIDHVIPHIGRALDIRRRLSKDRPAHQSLANLLNTINTPLFLVDASLKVLFATDSAEEIAVRGDGITIIRDRLMLPLVAETIAFQTIGEVDGQGVVPAVQRRVRVAGRDGRLRYLLRIHPAIGFAALPLAGPAAALIFVEPIRDARTLPSAEEIEAAFGLTSREAEVLSLVPTGGTRKDIGRALGVSENTIKSQLGAIFEKTGTHSMIELAVLIARCPMGDADDT